MIFEVGADASAVVGDIVDFAVREDHQSQQLVQACAVAERECPRTQGEFERPQRLLDRAIGVDRRDPRSADSLRPQPGRIPLHPTIGHQKFRSASDFGFEEVPLFPRLERTMEQLSHWILRRELVAGERGFASFAEVMFALVDEVDSRPFSPVHLHASADGLVLVADNRLGLAREQGEELGPRRTVPVGARRNFPESPVRAVYVVAVGGEDCVEQKVHTAGGFRPSIRRRVQHEDRRPRFRLVTGGDGRNEVRHPLSNGLTIDDIASLAGLPDVRPSPNPLRGIRIGLPTADVDESSRDLSHQVLELGGSGRSLVRRDVVLTLHTRRIRHACLTHRAEEPVVRIVWQDAPPPLPLPAAAALNTISNDSYRQMTPGGNDRDIAHNLPRPRIGSGYRHLT